MTKTLYKLELLLIKSLPLGIALCYLLNSILSYFNIDATILSYIAGMSLLPTVFILVSSFVFKFCIYHRIPIYYIILSDILNYYDLYIGIPLENRELFIMNMITAGIFIVLIVFTKAKICKDH
jgi:hypothetical protein